VGEVNPTKAQTGQSAHINGGVARGEQFSILKKTKVFFCAIIRGTRNRKNQPREGRQDLGVAGSGRSFQVTQFRRNWGEGIGPRAEREGRVPGPSVNKPKKGCRKNTLGWRVRSKTAQRKEKRGSRGESKSWGKKRTKKKIKLCVGRHWGRT